jgi:hypothetical protein
MATVTITVPDHQRVDKVAEYVRLVADQIEHGYTSGHVGPVQHWTSEGVR